MMVEFLDLVHHYALTVTKSEDHSRLNELLIGPPRIGHGGTRTHVDERSGLVPPVWWRGDKYASRSGVVAMMALKR